jgi:plastocyanin
MNDTGTERRSFSQYVAVLMAAAAFVLVAVAFASHLTEDTPAGPKIMSAEQAAASGKPVIELGEMYVRGDLSIAKGTTVVVANHGVAIHNLSIEGGSRTPDLDPGKAFELDTSTLPSGTYTVYCMIEGHRAAGMQANLVIGS